ncbi:MAG: DUF1439 domain-containing protein [Pseudomonadota bacterium]
MYTIVIPKDELQQRISSQFPISTTPLLLSFEISDPVVYFKGNNVGLKVRTELVLLMPSSAARYNGDADVNGAVVYNKNTKSFYLKDVMIEKLTLSDKQSNVQELPSKHKEELKAALEKVPIYSLNQKDFKHSLVKLFLKDVSVRDEKLILSLGV